ncbi:MAG: transcription-repair coupling factor [Rubritalea sp.]|uniref:transcription-repair coupling factor n=1 Tax=Rubritalea sp. TaxID=2109375 RepID=UPI003241EDDE
MLLISNLQLDQSRPSLIILSPTTLRKRKPAAAPGLDHATQICSTTNWLMEAKSRAPKQLGPVAPAGAAFLTALLATPYAKAHSQGRLWLLCDLPRLRERIADELPLWRVKSHLLKEVSSADQDSEIADPESGAERLANLHILTTPPSNEFPEVVILPTSILDESAPTPKALKSARLSFRVGLEVDIDALFNSLSELGFERVSQIHSRGQFAQRGGILDIYTWQNPDPIRLELFDIEIDSIRVFDLDTQTSRKKLDTVELAVNEPDSSGTIADFLGNQDSLVSLTEEAHPKATFHFSPSAPVLESGEADFSTALHGSPLGAFEAGDFVLQESKRHAFLQQIAEWANDDWHVHLVFANNGEKERFSELIGEDIFKNIQTCKGELAQGFTFPEAKLAILSSAELFGRYQNQHSRRSNKLDHQRRARAQTNIEDINEGDLVVHSEYGVGRFEGIETNSEGEEQIHIEFRDGAILSVPIDQSHLLARYIGMGGKTPPLSKLGDAKWAKSRKAAEKSILDYAAQLLKIQAERQTQTSQAHPPDTKWMWEFENSFRFTETPGQLEAIADTKADMESGKPMDRLICGDVGFGKTEVAIRAAFKAVTGGKQACLMAPTTVLAEQHWRTFRERMSDYPIRVELLNRFRTPSEIRKTLEGLANGSVDIVIGTHRLVSDDIVFKELGVAIVDEEQRFGVRHKEKFKERMSGIDMLTLSATPIPRTLYLSLMGARDMSTIDTAPPNKVPVQTSICAYDERIIRDAIQRELKRGGQVFFLHNRVQTIGMMKQKLLDLVPEARISIGHGQMPKEELEVVMRDFVRGEADILLATTIIESGIDIPNANTILIDRADRFGLSDLYQLRGRVGRAGEKAYAILLLPPQMVTGDARKRINAIKQYTALGSGFKIAMRDLEIRGAGNLLGTKQSGHIAAVGFDLYCQLLRQSIDRLRGNHVHARIDVTLRADFLTFNETEFSHSDADLNLPCYIPAAYMAEPSMRITAYKQLAETISEKELRRIADNWKDQFGRHPMPVKHLLQATKLKLAAAKAMITSIELQGQRLMLTRNGNYITINESRFPRLTEGLPAKKLNEAIQLLKSI